MPGCTLVDQNIYIGNYGDATNKGFLKSLGITHIVNCASEIENAFPQAFAYYNLYMNDNQEEFVSHLFNPVLLWIQEAVKKGRVLIHCAAGISRSATIIVAYLADKYNLPIPEALGFLRHKYRMANPNQNYFRQLLEWKQQEQNSSGMPRMFY